MVTNEYPNWLVPLDAAKKLKDLGFNEPCIFSYSEGFGITACLRIGASDEPYEVEFKGFEQKVETNFYDIYDRFSHVFLPNDYDENYHGYPTQELADAAEALRQLIFLRDYYNEGWQPNWKKEREIKYVIYNDSNKLATIQSYTFSYVLAFKEGNIRNKFLKEQRELLEKAKPLL